MRYKRKLQSRKQSGGTLTRAARAKLEDELRELKAEFESIECEKSGLCSEDRDTGYCQWCQDPSSYAEQKKLKDEIAAIESKLGN